MSDLAKKYWSCERQDAVVFRHVEDGMVVVWVDGKWIEFDHLGRYDYQPNYDDAVTAAAARRVGWAALEEAEREAEESFVRGGG
jgi:hypothetical protein